MRAGSLVGLELPPGSVHDRATAVAAHPVPPQGVRSVDLGFFKLARFREIAAADGFWFSRLLTGTTSSPAPAQHWQIDDFLHQQTTTRVDQWVTVGRTERVRARVLAVRVTQEVADQRRARLHAAAKRKGQAVSARRLASADWNVYVTNIPAELLSVEEAVVLASVRWQIELLFHRWKSQGRIDEWTASTNKWRMMREVYVKLIGMVLTHWLVVVSCWGLGDRSLPQATAVVRHYAMTLVSSWDEATHLVKAVEVMARVIQATCHLLPRQKAPLTYQLLRTPALLANRGILA